MATQLSSGSEHTSVGGGYLVTLKNVNYKPAKDSRRRVLNDITLEVEQGQFVAVVGSNGAGKSSLLAAIAGELRDQCSAEGEIRIGPHIIDKPVNQIMDGVGVVHQFDDLDLIGHLSVAQNIAIRQMLGGGHKEHVFATSKKWCRRIREELASKAPRSGLRLEEIVHNLAGGDRQLLSVLVAVHLEHQENPCRLLLLDEHTSRLDHKNAKTVMDYTVTAIRDNRLTAVMVTHRYSDAIEQADHIVVMRDGAIAKKINEVKEIRALTIQKLAELVEGTGK